MELTVIRRFPPLAAGCPLSSKVFRELRLLLNDDSRDTLCTREYNERELNIRNYARFEKNS
jgi:hypothetical protein